MKQTVFDGDSRLLDQVSLTLAPPRRTCQIERGSLSVARPPQREISVGARVRTVPIATVPIATVPEGRGYYRGPREVPT